MKIGKGILYCVGALVGFVYMLNPSAGVFELVPDTLPFVGNLDEAAAMGILIASIRGLRGLRSGGAAGADEDRKPGGE